MALSEQSLGRLLALAWVWRDQNGTGNFTFRDTLEKNPADGIKYLKDTTEPLPNNIDKRAFLTAIGLNTPSAVKDVIFDMDLIDYPQDADFKGAPCQSLEAWVSGNLPVEFEEDEWKLGIWLAPVTEPTGGALNLMQWSRIYARIWIDHRLNQLAQPCQTKYGPKKDYRTTFENDPAEVVDKICQELPTLGHPPIPYTKNTTRLFTLIPKPNTWTDAQLKACLGTGKLKGPKKKDHPLCWILRKCC